MLKLFISQPFCCALLFSFGLSLQSLQLILFHFRLINNRPYFCFCSCKLSPGNVSPFFPWTRSQLRDHEKGNCSQKCDQIWRNFATLAKCWQFFCNVIRAYLAFGKILNPFWAKLYNIEQILVAVNGRILKNLSNGLVTLQWRLLAVWPDLAKFRHFGKI